MTTMMMKAAMVHRYGGPEAINIESAPRPKASPGEVLVRVRASPVTAADVRLRSAVVPAGFGPLIRLVGGVFGPRNPIPGINFAGTIAEVGEGVTTFKVGDRVFGVSGFSGGSHAEFLKIRADAAIVPMPKGLSFEEAAAFSFGGLTSSDFLIDKAKLERGESLLVLGATGSVGSAAISLGRQLGLHVTAVASTKNLELARELGAHEVIDYTKEELRGTYDGILDVMGVLPYEKAKAFLKPGGRLMPVTSTLLESLGAALRPIRNGHRITGSTTSDKLENLKRLVSIYEAGGYKPLVGTVMPFEQIQEAHRVATTWHKRGNLILTMPAA